MIAQGSILHEFNFQRNFGSCLFPLPRCLQKRRSLAEFFKDSSKTFRAGNRQLLKIFLTASYPHPKFASVTEKKSCTTGTHHMSHATRHISCITRHKSHIRGVDFVWHILLNALLHQNRSEAMGHILSASPAEAIHIDTINHCSNGRRDGKDLYHDLPRILKTLTFNSSSVANKIDR